MTIKDVLDTPIIELWDAISPYAIGLFIIIVVLFVIVISFIISGYIRMKKRRKDFDKRWESTFKKKR